MKAFCLWSLLAVAGMTSTQSALGACASTSGNSCWMFVNELSAPASVRCKDNRNYLNSMSWKINPRDRVYHQFYSGWGDGMGFPEPGIKVQCRVVTPNGPSGSFDFTTLFWGDNVAIEIGRMGIRVKQTATWSPFESRSNTVSW